MEDTEEPMVGTRISWFVRESVMVVEVRVDGTRLTRVVHEVEPESERRASRPTPGDNVNDAVQLRILKAAHIVLNLTERNLTDSKQPGTCKKVTQVLIQASGHRMTAIYWGVRFIATFIGYSVPHVPTQRLQCSTTSIIPR